MLVDSFNTKVIQEVDLYPTEITFPFQKTLSIRVNCQKLEYRLSLLDPKNLELVCRDIIKQLDKVHYFKNISVSLK